MIINVRGTHGSGKSHLVRSIRDLYDDVQPQLVENRKTPQGYWCRSTQYAPIYIAGSYENECGGCDLLTNSGNLGLVGLFEMLTTVAANWSIVFEGIVAQHSLGRLLELHRQHTVSVVALSTPLKLCVESVTARRAQRGAVDKERNLSEFQSYKSHSARLAAVGAPISWISLTVSREFRGVESGLESMKKTYDAPVVHKLSREEAFIWCRDKLRVQTCAE